MSRKGMSVGGVLRGLLALVTLCWVVFGVFWALMILLPAPATLMVFIAVLFEGYSLLLAVYAVAGLGLAALARWAGARRVSLIAAVFAAVTFVLCMVPTVQGLRVASQEDVALSPSEYFSAPSFIADGTPETVTYARPDGDEGLKLDVWQPPGGEEEAGGKPAVVLVHGGGFNIGSRKDDPRWSEWYAENGYVVFDIDYRLAPPPRWQDATGDVKCAVGWARQNAERYGVDPERIALVGSSAGGNLALMAAYTDNETFQPSCAVGDTGVSAVATFYAPTALAPYWESEFSGISASDDEGSEESEPSGGLELFLDGNPEDVPDLYRIASPISHVDAGNPPTMLIHGGADQLVPPEQARLLGAELREAGVPHRNVELPGANHAFDYAWGGWDTQIARAELEEFLERNLVRSDKATE